MGVFKLEYFSEYFICCYRVQSCQQRVYQIFKSLKLNKVIPFQRASIHKWLKCYLIENVAIVFAFRFSEKWIGRIFLSIFCCWCCFWKGPEYICIYVRVPMDTIVDVRKPKHSPFFFNQLWVVQLANCKSHFQLNSNVHIMYVYFMLFIVLMQKISLWNQ